MATRFDNFLIWGHGLEHRDAIVAMIREQPGFEIVRFHRHRPRNIARFVREVYRYDSVPFAHLRAKTRYLLTTPAEVLGIFIRNHKPEEAPFGEGAFRRRACMAVKRTKEAIRDRFNPRLADGRRSEDHVIHASDHPKQVDHLLRVMGLLDGIQAIAAESSRVIDAPQHLGRMGTYRIRPIDSRRVRCTVLDGDPELGDKSLLPIERTPHFHYLRGEREAYAAYWRRYRDSHLHNDHSPEAFERLASNFHYLQPPHQGRYIIVRADDHGGYVILDGVHRAAILQHQGQQEWIAAVAS